MASNQTTLEFVLKAKDEASSSLKSFSANAQSVFKSFAVAGTAAFGALTAVVKTSIDASSEAADVQAQLGAVLKSTGGIAGVTAQKAVELSKALQKQTTFGDEAILSAENMLLTFTNIKDNVFPEATKTVLDMSVALGQDTKNSAIQLGKALNDPILGVTALRKVGVNFTESQRELIKSMVESGDVMGAQKLILKELATEFGGSAQAAADTFGGRMKQLKEIVGDLQEEIGNAFVPVLQSLTEKITPVVNNMIAWAQENPELVKNIILTVGAVSALAIVIGGLSLVLTPVIAGITLLLSPVGLLVTAFFGVAAAAIYFRDNLGELFQLLDEKTGIITFMKDAWDSVVQVFNNSLKPALAELWEALVPLKPFLEALGVVFGTILVIALASFVKALQIGVNMLTLVLTGATKLAEFLTTVLAKAFEFIGGIVQGTINFFKNLTDAVNRAIDALSRFNVIQGAKNYASNVAGGFNIVKESVGNFFGGKRADGGSVMGGRSYLVGERGAELFTPNATGRITPMTGGNVTLVIKGNTFMGDEDMAVRIGDMIVNRLQMVSKIGL